MDTQVLASIDQKLGGIDTKFSTQITELNEKFGAQLAELSEVAKKALETKADDDDVAELGKTGVLGDIMKVEVWGIPVAQAAIGGFVAVFASEVIDGFLAEQKGYVKGLVKLAGAGLAIHWGDKILGSTGAKAVALLLAYDGIRSLLPVDQWATQAAAAVSGVLPSGGLGGAKALNPGGNGRGEVKSLVEYNARMGR